MAMKKTGLLALGSQPATMAVSANTGYKALDNKGKLSFLQNKLAENLSAEKRGRVNKRITHLNKITGTKDQRVGIPGGENPTKNVSTQLSNNPTPQDIVSAQEEANRKAEEENMRKNDIGTEGPYGSTQYVTMPDGTRKLVTELSDAEKNILQGEQGLVQNAQGSASNAFGQYNAQGPLDFSGANSLTNDFSADRTRIEDQLYNRFAGRANEQFTREKSQLENDLVNKGFQPGTKAYQQQMDDFERRKQDALMGAQTAATQFGGQEQQNMFGMNMQTRQQQVGEQLTKRNQPLQELSSLMSWNRGANQPQAMNPYQTNYKPVDVTGIGGRAMEISAQERMQQQKFEQDKKLAEMQGMINQKIARISNAGNLTFEQKKELESLGWELANKYKKENSGGLSPWGQVGVNVGGGILQGVGAGIGDWIGGKIGGGK